MDIRIKDVLVRMLSTPNPYALKFVLNVPLKNKGRASFHNKEEAAHLQLFSSLFDIQGVKQVFVFQNQMTLTHDGTLSEKDIEQHVHNIVKTRISVHDADFLSFEEQEQAAAKEGTPSMQHEKILSPEVKEIDAILDRTIRPGLRADGGDVEILSVQGDEVQIAYQGACGGCPSAMMGTLEAMENILQQETGREKLKITVSS